MSMNFNGNSKPTVQPKKNHNLGIIIAVTLATIGAIGIIHHVMSVQDSFDNTGIKFTKTDSPDLEQKLFDKCQQLQDWYRSLDGFEGTNYHCDKYAKAWSGLAK